MWVDSISAVYWKAIKENDYTFDQVFLYGVRTTKVFCRPSCRSRVPDKKNVFIFTNFNHAIEAGFRPCKRCKPEQRRSPNEEWIDEICSWIEAHYNKQITLAQLGEAFHASPYHLQRTFKKVTGDTPHGFIRKIRMKTAKHMLANSDMPVAKVGHVLGFPNTSYFMTVFKKEMLQTPNEYRRQQVRRSDNGSTSE